MADEKEELKKIYTEINSIESKIGNLQGELRNLKTKLDTFIEKKESSEREDSIVDPLLEEELTSPITESLEAVPEKKITPFETKPIDNNPKEKSLPVGIVRPSLVLENPIKKPETISQPTANISSSKVSQTTKSYQQQPDLLDDLKNWIKGKIGNIPIEEFLGVNLLNKIGLLLLVMGFSFFLRLTYNWIGPFAKIGGMLILSSLVFWGGNKFYKNKAYSIFGLGMIAASFALFYFTIFASYNVEVTRIIPLEYKLLGFILLLVSSVVMIGVSLWYKKEALTSFAYFLGFLTISINENSDFNYFSMIAVLILSISLIGIMTVMHWKYLTGIGIFASYLNYWLYAQGLPRTEDGHLLKISESGHNYFIESILYLLSFWVIFFLSTFTMKVREKKDEKIASAINVVNAFSFFSMFLYIRPEATEWGSFTVTMGMGIVYLFGAYIGRKLGREFLWNSSLILGVSLITLSIPSKFSNYGHVFGWLIEGTTLIVISFVYRETYLRNLGYLVLILNLWRFYTLPYNDFYYSSTNPNLVFDLNRGMIYIFMLFSFFGLIPIIRKYLSDWTKTDKFVYSSLGFLGSLTLYVFSFYLIEKPFQVYIILPGAGLLLLLALLFKNRIFYYSSVSLTLISLLPSFSFIFPKKIGTNELHSILSSLLLILANLVHYFLSKKNLILRRYLGSMNTVVSRKSKDFSIKTLFAKGETFLWVVSISFVGFVLNEVNPFIHAIILLFGVIACLAIFQKFKQGIYQTVFLFGFVFLVGLYRYKIYQDGNYKIWSEEMWLAAVNLIVFWFAGFTILGLMGKYSVKEEVQKILSPILISATSLVGMLIGNILVEEPYLLSYSAVYSLFLVGFYKFRKEEFFIYNSVLISWFSLVFGLGIMLIKKENPVGIYEYINLSTYTVSSILTTILCFHLTSGVFVRILFYAHSLLTNVCFILIVVPSEYKPIAFSILHFGHIFFHFKSSAEKFYEYSYLTLGISVLAFLYQTDFLSSKILWDTKGILLILIFSLLFLGQTVFIFYQKEESRDRFLYYILNFIILFWAFYSVFNIEYVVFLFSIFVYINGILLSKFKILEIEKTYYYPLIVTIFTFLVFLFSNEPGILEEMNYKNFLLGIITLFFTFMGVKEVENFKLNQTDLKQTKYSFEKIVTLILFLEFILLTMTIVDVRFWSLIWTIEALGFISYGVIKSLPLIRYAGFGLIGLAVIKLGFWDLQNLKENLRVLVLMSIGALFVIASFLYAKYKERLFKKEE